MSLKNKGVSYEEEKNNSVKGSSGSFRIEE